MDLQNNLWYIDKQQHPLSFGRQHYFHTEKDYKGQHVLESLVELKNKFTELLNNQITSINSRVVILEQETKAFPVYPGSHLQTGKWFVT